MFPFTRIPFWVPIFDPQPFVSYLVMSVEFEGKPMQDLSSNRLVADPLPEKALSVCYVQLLDPFAWVCQLSLAHYALRNLLQENIYRKCAFGKFPVVMHYRAAPV